jgi:hypothetical protein
LPAFFWSFLAKNLEFAFRRFHVCCYMVAFI